jgi:CubicO group peptidase (beta-lactamase class C family)
MKQFLLLLSLFSFNYLLSQESRLNYQIDSLLKTVSSKNEPGLSIGVIKNAELIYHNQLGLANLEYEVPLNDSTIFGLASITKQFTAACIGVLEKKQLLNVNDDVRKHVPQLPFFGDTIRIKHLLNHTSGLRNHNVLLDLKGFDLDHRGYTNKMIEQLTFLQKDVNNRPGAKMLYANTNYVLLALIIKKISGLNIVELAKKELFAPLKMEHTFYQSNLEQIIKNRAYSYYQDNGVFRQPKSLTLCVGAGGIGSTIGDMKKWSSIFLNENSDFNYLKSFLTKTETLPNGTSTACARGVFISQYNGYNTIHHGGRGLGMRSQFICLPEINVAITIFTNSENINADRLSYKIIDFLIKDKKTAVKKTQVDQKFKQEKLNNFTGVYRELNSDLLMTITAQKDTLMAKSSYGKSAIHIVSKAKRVFQRFDNNSVVYTFLSEGSNEADLLVTFGGVTFCFEKVELATGKLININDYLGEYYSIELDVFYEISEKDNNLILNYLNNVDIPLKRSQKDEFGSGRRTKYTFIREKNGEIKSFKVSSEGTVKNIMFKKK